MKFRPGVSGNPAGRPKGKQNRRTALKELLDPHADKLVEKAVQLALDGDVTALRLCLERIIPPVKAKDDTVIVSDMNGSLSEKAETVANAMAMGRLTPDQGQRFLSGLAMVSRVREVDELAKRVEMLEERAL